MTTVRDLFIKALSMKVHDVPCTEIRVQLVTRGSRDR
jgi:hypothetical protein